MDTYTVSATDGVLTSSISGNIVVSIANSTTTLWNGSSSTWLTSGNWDNGIPSSTKVAQFSTATQTTVGINMNGITIAQRTIAAVEFLSGAIARTINNNSTTAANNIILSGGVVNGIMNVILRNNSNNLMTIADGSSKTLGIALVNATDNLINIDGSGGITISCGFSGSNPLTKAGSGLGKLVLAGTNTYTGLTTVSAGTLQLIKSGGTTIPITNSVTVSGGTLQISSNQTLADLTISSGRLTIDDGVTLTISGTLTYSGGTINYGTTPTGKLIIASSGKMIVSSGTFTTSGNLTLKSDANGTAKVGTTTGAITGNVTVERYIPLGKRAFRLLTPSVTTTSTIYNNWQIGGANTAGRGTHITGSTTGANGFDLTASGNPSMYTYENNVATGTGWLAIPTTNATNLTAGIGYRTLVRGDRNVNISVASTDNMNVATTLSATGTLKVGDAVFDGTTIPALNTTANTTTNGFSLIGNPYASPVDWSLVTKVNVGDTYYTWDPNMGTPAQRGSYVAYSASLATNDVSGSAVSQYIQPGQAIFVKTTAANPVLTFKETDKVSSFTNVFRTNESNSRFSISVYNPTEVAFAAPIDGTTAVFGTDFTSAVGFGDVEKLFSAGENLAWSRATKLLAIDAQAPAVANDELHLKTMQFVANKSYTFKINATNFDSSLSAFLVDQYLNTQTQVDLTAPNFVTFATTADAASYGTDRFKVVFNPSSALYTEEWNSKALRIYPNPVVDNQFTIGVSPSITDNVAITIYNMIGQSVYKQTATAINNAIVVRPSVLLKSGVYMVEMVNNGKTSTQKIIIK